MAQFYKRIFQTYWNPYFSIGLAGILSAFYFGITGTVWAVTGEFTRFGGHILNWFGIDVSNWGYFKLIKMSGTPIDRTDGWIVIGMILGAWMTVFLSKSFKIRIPRQKRRFVQGFIGGIIAGFGARLAMGCNLAAFFTGVPQFSFHAWIFMGATAFGTYIGVKIVNTRWWVGSPNLRAATGAPIVNSSPKRIKSSSWQPIAGAGLAVLLLCIIVYYAVSGKLLLAVAALIGMAFGVLIERGQICFTSAFRDLWISGRAVMTKAITVGIMLSVVLTFIFIEHGSTALIKVAAPSTLVGGLLFGIGIVLAGGCETGMMYRAMEGQVVFWAVGAGNIVGATLLAYGWDHWGIFNALVKGWQPINLIHAWGAPMALIGTLLMLAILYFAADWWQNHYRFGKGLELEKQSLLQENA